MPPETQSACDHNAQHKKVDTLRCRKSINKLSEEAPHSKRIIPPCTFLKVIRVFLDGRTSIYLPFDLFDPRHQKIRCNWIVTVGGAMTYINLRLLSLVDRRKCFTTLYDSETALTTYCRTFGERAMAKKPCLIGTRDARWTIHV